MEFVNLLFYCILFFDYESLKSTNLSHLLFSHLNNLNGIIFSKLINLFVRMFNCVVFITLSFLQSSK